MTPPRLAIVGCGCATRELHLPAVSGAADFRLTGLVDVSVDRARELAQDHGVPWVAEDYREAIGRADAVLLAVPHHLHAPMTIDLLGAGMHVLVEKPMAPSVAECDRMIEAADESGTVLAVGLMRRFYDWTGLVARFVRGGALGKPCRVQLSEGERYRQRVQSDFRFRREQSGGGVLVDRGIHVLDLLGWWFGELEHVEHRDDADGGVEAECRLQLEFAGGVGVDVLLTRLRNVQNRYRIEFERGSLLVDDPGDPVARVRLEAAGLGWVPTAEDQFAPGSAAAWTNVFRRQLADFAGAIRGEREPLVPGREGRRSIELLERCYAVRKPLEHPWEPVGPAPRTEAAAR